MSLEEAVNKSADDCIRQGLIPEYLTARRGELMQMTLGEIPLEEMKEVWYDEGIEKGRAEGKAEGKAEVIRFFLNRSHDAWLVASSLGESIDYVRQIAKDNNITLNS